MFTHLAIITMKRIKATKKSHLPEQTDMICLVSYVSQLLGMVLSTLYGEGRACLAGNNYGNYVVF